MDHKQFQEWLSGIDHLSPARRQQTEVVCLGDTETSASLAAIEAAMGEDRQCPHCGTSGAISRGKARDLRRYQCKGCRKTFNAATGTPLSGLHRKDKWLSFGACLADGLTVRASAKRCGLAVNTALRWRHRFLAAKDLKARKLTGIVEADEPCVLESRKGARNLERKARRRGGRASKFHKAFSEMCSRHLVNPIACSRAAGWEQGQVENLVKETRAFSCTPRLEVADFEELNERPRQDAIKRAKKLRHPAAPERTVREMFQRERPFLTPLPKPFVGFREKTVAVTRTGLINFDSNRYSVEARAVGRPVQLHVHAARIVICQDGEIVGAHERCFGRGQTIFNPWHHVPVLKRKPGALRNGGPCRDWTLPSAMSQFWTHLSDVSDGNRQMVDILFAAHEHSICAITASMRPGL